MGEGGCALSLEMIQTFIRPDAIILIPTLYLLGIFLRQTPHVPLWLHAWIKMFFAVIACILYYGFEIASVVQGILCAGVAVLLRDLIENTTNRINISIKNNKKDKDE